MRATIAIIAVIRTLGLAPGVGTAEDAKDGAHW
jgi:hypothetical protein